MTTPPARRRLSLGRLLAFTIVVLLAAVVVVEAGYRAVLSVRTPADRQEAFDLYVLGGSSAFGEPWGRELGFGPRVAARLGGAVGDRPIRVILLAEPGHSTLPQVELLRRTLRRRNPANPGAVLIYAGHNEHLGADDVVGWGGPGSSPWDPRLWAMGRSILFGDVFLERARRFGSHVLHGIAGYEWALRQAVQLTEDAGLTPVLSTVVSNEVAVEPSVFSTRPLPEVDALFAPARALESEQRWAEAEAAWSGVAGEHALERIAAFRAAQMARRQGAFDRAQALLDAAHFRGPVEHFGRARPEQNAIARALAREHDLPLVDAQARFRADHPQGLIGGPQFVDGHHPSQRGIGLLAEGFAEVLAASTDAELRGPRLSDAAWVASAGSDDVWMEAWLRSAMWLFSTTPRHPLPELHLQLARQHLDRALAQDPDEPRALLLSALVQAAADHRLLYEPDAVAWAEEHRLFWHALSECADQRQVAAAVARLSELGSDAAALQTLASRARELPERCAGR